MSENATLKRIKFRGRDMKDINGRELKTGQVVEIKNAYFKNDNGLYYIDNTPGDPTWSGNDYSLKKICKNGKISKSGHICFWPIKAFVSNSETCAIANDWNKENATIEIKDGVCVDYIRDKFIEKANNMKEIIKHYTWNFGEDSKVTKQSQASYKHYMTVASSL